MTFRPTTSDTHGPIGHPGDLLRRRLARLGMRAEHLARSIHVSPKRVRKVLEGRRAVTAVLALRLGRFLGEDPFIWLEAQGRWDLRRAMATGKAAEIARIDPLLSARHERTRFAGA
jgi:addiction module HigA family antidote